jgi:Tfp pilus assembly protein FimT
MVVVAVAGILGGMAVLEIGSMRRGLEGDGAMRVVMGRLNLARETAVARRELVRVDFVGTNTVRTTVEGEVDEVMLESGVQFALVQGIPDTPDAFGRVSETTFGSITQTTIFFNSEGSMVDAGGSPINGTVFMAKADNVMSARAVTVLGTTGRVRGHRWDGRQWARV